MVLGLGSISLALLLVTNGVAILNEERFLARIGWSQSQMQFQQQQMQMQDTGGYGGGGLGSSAGGSGEPGIKARLVNLISAVRMLMRLPLIVINIVVILYLLILG
ncbi:hypothetical protein CF319_g6494 [Tilletia indica]|uniref:Yos1-like protein n=2 Tax=Tilletia TaxID=13289 RepID=A0A8X7N9J6_9BASI|nr:hypothetical protein CF327_g2796 [Tilletia walkeri]KAE8219891.1 hypothetical protein CF319_g6494 [Tilletia indica]KAE8233605.1 hypothetical protein CF326_g1356 [Tilletia indica]KAE8246259.1 hypothetical protein A4X13_0g5869 [Tilletia indica]KAE8268883.1 hypothetical protein A4X09_0g3468 [Tilletia walkeri]